MDAAIDIAGVQLKNPIICGSGEHLIEEDGIEGALAAGAAAVVMKSTNESEAAKRQLDHADYALLDADWRPLPWDKAAPRTASLFCRSGLSPLAFDDWLDLLSRTDRFARKHDAYVIASVIPADVATAVNYARRMEAAGARIVELNIGAPHGGEAAPGAILLEREAARVKQITAQVRAALSGPLWVKLTGQSDDVAGLAVAAFEGGADAVTLMGRFMAFVPDIESLQPVLGSVGAIGGYWALPLTCRWLALSRARLGPGPALLATNGARNGLDVARFLLAGASAVQMTSAVMSGGPAAVERAIDDFKSYLAHKKLTASELIGRAADALKGYGEQPHRPDHWRRFR